MDKKYFFLSGLPRSGATLLSSILNQNPDIHSGPDSPVCGLINQTLQFLDNNEQHILYPKNNLDNQLIQSILSCYYSDVKSNYIIDKCRIWNNLHNINIIKRYINPDVRIICCVRSILEILASYISLIKKSPHTSFVDHNLSYTNKKINDENRCEWLMKKDGLIDISLSSLKESISLPYIHLIDYNMLVSHPHKVVSNLYEFLSLPEYQHDFSNIVNNFTTKDHLLGLPDLHKVKSTIQIAQRDISQILPETIIKKYSSMEFWS